jgi:hypothetical protein
MADVGEFVPARKVLETTIEDVDCDRETNGLFCARRIIKI